MDQDRARAASFAAVGGFSEVFSAIADQSPTIIAGLAESIRVTAQETPTERVYYMLTAEGLHVGQEVTEAGRFLRRKTKRDYFVPASAISATQWDPSGMMQVDVTNGVRVIMRFADVFGQFADHVYDEHKGAAVQAQDLHAAVERLNAPDETQPILGGRRRGDQAVIGRRGVEVIQVLPEPHRSLLSGVDEGDFAVINEHLACWVDVPKLDERESTALRDAWRSNLPQGPALVDEPILENPFGWVVVGVATKAAIGILRAWMAAGRDPRPYLHDSGPDHLDFDLPLGFENHWAGLRDDFPPTEAIRSAFRGIGTFGPSGVPGPGIKHKREIWDAFTGVARIRAVDAVPHHIYDWSRMRAQPLLAGATYRLDPHRQMRPLDQPLEFASWDEWLAVLSVRCGWAHALCAPDALKALWATLAEA